jgi:hypothetical protein
MKRRIALTAMLLASVPQWSTPGAADVFNYPAPSHECLVCRDACANSNAACIARAATSSTRKRDPQSCAQTQRDCVRRCAKTTAFCLY